MLNERKNTVITVRGFMQSNRIHIVIAVGDAEREEAHSHCCGWLNAEREETRSSQACYLFLQQRVAWLWRGC